MKILTYLKFNNTSFDFLFPKKGHTAQQHSAQLLATALSKIPDKTREYVTSSTLPQDVIRLYVRKSRESFRTRDVYPF